MTPKWTSGYCTTPAWIIGDGEPDWAVGDEFDWFVVEFWSEVPLVIGTEKARFASQANDYSYRVSAEVLHLFPTQKLVVLDFGLMVIGNSDHLPANVRVGDFVIRRNQSRTSPGD